MMSNLQGDALRQYRVSQLMTVEEWAEAHNMTPEEVIEQEAREGPDYINDLEG